MNKNTVHRYFQRVRFVRNFAQSTHPFLIKNNFYGTPKLIKAV